MSVFEQPPPSTRPYLIRALHEWCTENGFSPHFVVQVDASVQVPMAFVKNDEIVLNVSFDATSALRLGNELVEFKARFGGAPHDIVVPVSHVIAMYARENGQGMAFPAPARAASVGVAVPAAPPVPTLSVRSDGDPRRSLHSVSAEAEPGGEGDSVDPSPDGPAPGTRPQLKRIK